MRCEKELVMGSEKEGFQTTQRPPQEVSRRPRTLQGLEVGANLAPRGVPKSIQNRSKSELGSLQDPRPPPREGKLTPKSNKKRLILTPKICKKRPASRFVFQRFWVGKSEAQYQKRASKKTAESRVTKKGRVASNEKTAESPRDEHSAFCACCFVSYTILI